MPDHLRVRRGAPLDAKRRIPASPCRRSSQSAGSFPLHAADARAEAAFAHRPEHRQQSCRHRHRDQQFRPQGHGGFSSVPWRCFPRLCICSSPGGGIPSPTSGLRKSSAWPGVSIFSARWRTCPRCTGQWICSSCLRFMTPVPTRCLRRWPAGSRCCPQPPTVPACFCRREHVTPDPGDAEDLAARIRALIDEPAPGPFRIPDHIQAGLDTWVQVVNEECDQRTGKSGEVRERKADGTEENEGNGKKPHPSPSQDF